MKNLIVAPAPHAHGGDSVRKNMLLVVLALLPAYIMSVVAFGVGALITAAIAVAACVLFEWLIAKFLLKIEPTLCDGSAILTGLLLAMNLPSNLDWWIVLIGALVAIGIGKMSFGGLGQNVFNPALVGRVFLLISFPVQMTTWPLAKGFETSYLDAETGATPLANLANANLWDAFTGFVGGSMGEVSAIALILGGILLICTKVITWHIPVSILGTSAIFAACAALLGGAPEGMCPCQYVGLTLCSGGMLLGAIFMATDYVTSPMSAWGKIIYGIGIGLIVMVIRTWGAYPEGMSFAILIMNAVVPLLNKIRPTRFGEKKKA